MTTYFDNIAREIDKATLEEAIQIEEEMVRTVVLACGDREFPHETREQMMAAIATEQMCPQYTNGPDDPLANQKSIQYFNILGTSRLLDTLHGMFHNLALRRVQTRFGVLLDDPSDIVRARDAHDTKELV